MTAPYYADESVTLYLGDCLEVLRGLPADSVDAIVTDPPAGIAFMGREWDDFQRARCRFTDWLTERMSEALRVLKPGGHALVWSLPRTSHWTAWALEDAGLEIRDCILHLFGSGFPKSLDVSKAIDKANGRRWEDRYALGRHIRERREAAGLTRAEVNSWFGYQSGCEHWESQAAASARVPAPADWQVLADRLALSGEYLGLVMREEAEREVVGSKLGRPGYADTETTGRMLPTLATGNRDGYLEITAPATEDAARWDGWGTALKPGQEMWWLARKPLAGTVAANVLRYGTGALNVDGCRVPGTWSGSATRQAEDFTGGSWAGGNGKGLIDLVKEQHDAGRWPANLVFTHSAACDGECVPDCPVAELDRQSGVLNSHGGGTRSGSRSLAYRMDAQPDLKIPSGDSGGASRFYPVFRYQAKAPASERPRLEDGTAHETVKPLGFVRWAVRLITPPGGTVLDMFAGSGPVAEACIIEGFRCVIIEKERKSADLIRKRLSKPIQPVMFGLEA